MKFNNNEEAVSPVIGVILMVAITVILAAVIAVFVFGMADDIQTTHVVSLTAKHVGDTAVVTFNGGADASSLGTIKMVAYGSTGALSTKEFGIVGNVASGDAAFGAAADGAEAVWGTTAISPTIGNTITIGGAAGKEVETGDRIVFIGIFKDGAEQMILDKTF